MVVTVGIFAAVPLDPGPGGDADDGSFDRGEFSLICSAGPIEPGGRASDRVNVIAPIIKVLARAVMTIWDARLFMVNSQAQRETQYDAVR